MKFNPHAYQQYAIEYIKTHPVAALLLDMGLGKTVTTLTAIRDLMQDTFEVQRVLVVAPLRVARDTWPEEIRKWDHLKDLTCSVVVGTVTERRRALQKAADIYIVNRENLVWLSRNCRLDFDMVVLDELSSFKNPQAQRFKAMKVLRPKVKRIVGLTGTPSGNGLMDLWAEFRLLDMGERLGKYISQYRNTYFQPDKRNGMVVFSYKLLPGAEEAIYRKIADITVSMKATDYLKMPALVSVQTEVNLSEAERKRYNDFKKSLVMDLPGGEVTAANAAALTLKLSQMANGAIYTDDGKTIRLHDRKLDALEDLVESANGRAGPCGLLVPARQGADPGADGSQGTEGVPGLCRLECREDPGGSHPPGFCRPWAQPAAGRIHPDLVRADLESGTLPADGGETLAAGPGKPDGHCPSHCG